MLVAAVFACALGGCFSYHPARDRDRAESVPLSADAWGIDTESQEFESLARLRDATPLHEIARFDIDTSSGPSDERAFDLSSVTRLVTANSLSETGLLRVWETPGVTDTDPRPHEWISTYLVVPPNASFLTPRQHAAVQARRAVRQRVLESARGETPPAERPPPQLVFSPVWGLYDGLEEGVRLRLPPDVEPDARGLMIYLPALIPNTYEYRVVEYLRDLGFAMLYVDGSSRVAPHNAEAIEAARTRRHILRYQKTAPIQREIDAKLAEARDDDAILAGADRRELVERLRAANDEARRESPLPPTGFEYAQGQDVQELAERIAGAVDDTMAPWAFAAEAAARHMFDLHPHLTGKPIVIVGFSGGGLTAPTVTARLAEAFPDQPIALVLVGTGGDVLSTALDSNLTNGGLNVEDDEPLPDSVRTDLVDRYRTTSRLDPLRAMQAIRDVPVLHVYARKDATVPTSGARALNAAHGGVDRLVFSGGHYTLFYFLPRQRARIADWIEDAITAEKP